MAPNGPSQNPGVAREELQEERDHEKRLEQQGMAILNMLWQSMSAVALASFAGIFIISARGDWDDLQEIRSISNFAEIALLIVGYVLATFLFVAINIFKNPSDSRSNLEGVPLVLINQKLEQKKASNKEKLTALRCAIGSMIGTIFFSVGIPSIILFFKIGDIGLLEVFAIVLVVLIISCVLSISAIVWQIVLLIKEFKRRKKANHVDQKQNNNS